MVEINLKIVEIVPEIGFPLQFFETTINLQSWKKLMGNNNEVKQKWKR